VDFAASPVQKLLADVAGRFEHFTDAGNTSIGKLAARYDFARQPWSRSTIQRPTRRHCTRLRSWRPIRHRP
jgi:iron complex outermembrane receptor protein